MSTPLTDAQHTALAAIAGLNNDPFVIRHILERLQDYPLEDRAELRHELDRQLDRRRNREAWRPREEVEAIVGPEIVAELIDLELAVEWVHADGPQLVVTVWGAYRAGLRMDERLVVQTPEGVDMFGEPLPESIVEIDRWEVGTAPKRNPIRLPGRQGVYELPFPNLVMAATAAEAEEPKVEYKRDSYTEEPVVVFAGDGKPIVGGPDRGGLGKPNPFGTRGIPIEIDKRLGKSKRAG